jgi:hypothetical protein
MLWWFLILAVGGGAVLWAIIAFYFRIRHHMPGTAAREGHSDHEHDAGSS